MTSWGLAPAADGNGLIGSWSPGIGDPSLVGWITTCAYFATAWRCGVVVRRTPDLLRESRRERRLWTLLAFLFLALGINKQLDLQSAVTELGHMLARSQGWYEERRAVQAALEAARS